MIWRTCPPYGRTVRAPPLSGDECRTIDSHLAMSCSFGEPRSATTPWETRNVCRLISGAGCRRPRSRHHLRPGSGGLKSAHRHQATACSPTIMSCSDSLYHTRDRPGHTESPFERRSAGISRQRVVKRTRNQRRRIQSNTGPALAPQMGIHFAPGLLMSPKHAGRRRRSDTMERPAIMATAITTVQDEDGMFVVECPAIPGCVSQGPSREEAEQNIREAIRQCRAVRREQGLPV